MIKFKEDGNEYWFDADGGETNYQGDNSSITTTLENIKSIATVEEPVSGDGVDLDTVGPSDRVYSSQKAREVVISLLESRQGVSIIEDEKSLPSLFRKAEWEPYVGPSGGEGWKNPNTNEVVYQDEPPGDSEYQEFDGELEEGQVLVFTDPTTNDTNMEEVEVVDSGTFDTTIEGPDGERVDIPSQKLIDGVVAETGDGSNEQSQRGGIDLDRAVSEQSLEEKLDRRLFGTASNMDVLEMEDGSEVFRVEVDDEQTQEARDRTMTAYNFLEEIGGYATEYDVAEDGSWFASREVDGEILRTAPDEYRDKIEKDHVTEVMAEQLIVGNWDAHPENLAVDEDGQLQVFDFDNASSNMSEYENISAFRETLSYVSGMVDDDIDMDEVTEKAEELVTQISLNMVDSVEGEKGSNSEFLEKINMNLGAIIEGEL